MEGRGHHTRVRGLVGALLWVVVPLAAEGQAPEPRNQPGAARLPGSGALVIFGGQSRGGDQLDDTWVCSGEGWTRLRGPGPSARSTPLARSPRGQLLLFGGYDGGRRSDTWLLDDDGWREAPRSGPPPRSGHALAYDEARGMTVMFGGAGVDGLLGDTWAWDGVEWRSVGTSGPSPRRNHAMAYDPASRRIVLFGGSDASGRASDTWVWDGRRWEQSTGGPAPRDHHAMAPGREEVFMFGGWAGEYLGDLWEWRDGAWSLIEDVGPARAGRPGLVAGPGGLVLFGGGAEDGFVSDPRVFQEGRWRNGNGCA